MDLMDTQVLRQALQWHAQGHDCLWVTVARTWGSAPRPPGAWMVVRKDGALVGSVSGGCIEDDLVRRTLAGEFSGGHPEVLKYGVDAEQARRFGLPCGGTIEMLLETQPDWQAAQALLTRIQKGELCARTVDVKTGATQVEMAHRGLPFEWTGERLRTVHGPGLRLLIIGAGQISQCLAPIAQSLGYAVFMCDPRQEYQAAWSAPEVQHCPGMPDDVVRALDLDPHSAVVALTHDPKLDDMALLEALKTPAFYVGALGSLRNNQNRRERLLKYFDLTLNEVNRLHGPVGLPIGSHTPSEIAVSIAAEMTAVKNGVLRTPRHALQPSDEPATPSVPDALPAQPG